MKIGETRGLSIEKAGFGEQIAHLRAIMTRKLRVFPIFIQNPPDFENALGKYRPFVILSSSQDLYFQLDKGLSIDAERNSG